MSDIRIIKKYPNRRLYDTEISKYITLEDVKKLVLEGVDFCVKDVKSDEDLTRSILLQIISEQEHDSEPMFSTATLTKLIRFYGNTYQSAFTDYLQKSLELFSAQQQEFQKGIQKATINNPMGAFQQMAEQNLEMWKQVQENFLKASGIYSSSGKNPGKDDE